MPKIDVQPDYPEEDFATAIEELLAEGRLVTSSRVAEIVGCSRETARQYLVEQADEGNLDRDPVGGGAVIYLPPEDELATVEKDRVVVTMTPGNELLHQYVICYQKF